MLDKFKAAMLRWNEEGLPIPLLRDGKKQGSYTLTMMVISFNVAIIALFGKVTQLLGDVNYWEVLGLLGLTSGLYVGRKYQVSKDGKMSLDAQEKEE
jgi:hypothetical protein